MNQPTDGQGGDSRSRIDVYRCRNVTNLIQPTFTSSWGPAWGCTMFLPKKLSFDHLVLGYFSAELWVDLLLWGVIRIRSRVLQWVESSFLLNRSLIWGTNKGELSPVLSWRVLISTSTLLLFQRLRRRDVVWKRKKTSSPSSESSQPELQNVKSNFPNQLGSSGLGRVTCTNKSRPYSRLWLVHSSPFGKFSTWFSL